MSEAIVTVKKARKAYGKFEAVRNVSFEEERGEVFGILGPNGAGKTSTLEMIEGLREIDGGAITVDGINVAKNPFKVKEIIGVKLQSSAFFENSTLAELIVAFAAMYGQTADPISLL